MGGVGSGGRRPHAGRPRKSNLELSVTNPRARVLTHPNSAEPPAVDEFDAPDDLSPEERNVWLELAPFAFANRTLTRATSLAFRMLCRNIVLERSLGQSADRGGPNHRGLIQRVDAELLRFNLSPCGKAIAEAEPEKVANKLDRFTKKARA